MPVFLSSEKTVDKKLDIITFESADLFVNPIIGLTKDDIFHKLGQMILCQMRGQGIRGEHGKSRASPSGW